MHWHRWNGAIGRVSQAAATTLFALFFLSALVKAFHHIRTIRSIVGAFFATSRLTGLTLYEFFGAVFWIGFVLHLIAAEVWIQRTRPLGHIL